MRKVCYRLDQIEDNSEKTKIENAINKLSGVNNIDIDEADSLVVVEFQLPTTERKIKDCLISEGHNIIM